MTVKALMEAARRNGMKVLLDPKRPGICAVVCLACGYGGGLFDTRMKGYLREPYSCPRCAARGRK